MQVSSISARVMLGRLHYTFGFPVLKFVVSLGLFSLSAL